MNFYSQLLSRNFTQRKGSKMNRLAALHAVKHANKVEMAAAEEDSVPGTITGSNSRQYVRLVAGILPYHLNLLLANLYIAENVSSNAGKLKLIS